MAIIYKTNGSVKEGIEPKDQLKGFQLDELKNHLQCEIVEVVYLKNGRLLLVDEEATLRKKPINDLASYVAGMVIFGTALECSNDQFL